MLMHNCHLAVKAHPARHLVYKVKKPQSPPKSQNKIKSELYLKIKPFKHVLRFLQKTR